MKLLKKEEREELVFFNQKKVMFLGEWKGEREKVGEVR